jgi:outer membrane protein assembly factor BamA
MGRLYKPAGRPAQKDASMFGLGGMYAEGGSWAAAAGDRRFWGDAARWKTTLAAGLGEVKYPVHLADGIVKITLPVIQKLEGGLLKVAYEAADDLWVTGGVSVASTRLSVGDLSLSGASSASVDVGTIDLVNFPLSVDWDTRSDQFYPRDGLRASVEATVSDGSFGSDYDYVNYAASINGYRPFGPRHTLAWRLAGEWSTGKAPFFLLPWYGSGVDLRGYAPGTYIGKRLAAAQAEWRWQATQRIGLVAFAGVGGVWGEVPIFEQEDFLPAGGVGLRWRLAEKFPVNFRVDYAWGRGDEVLLISVGEAF